MSAADIKALILARDARIQDNASLDLLITEALKHLNESRLGTSYTLAVALLVLHWYAKNPNVLGGENSVTGEQEGDLRREYLNPSLLKAKDDYDTTGYGRELKTLIETHCSPINVTRAYPYVPS